MKKVKRVLGLLVCIILLISVFTGKINKKASAAGAKKKPVKLVFWGAIPPESGPQKLIEDYKLIEPDVTVEYVRYLNNDQGNIKLDTALMAGEEIDIFTSYGRLF